MNLCVVILAAGLGTRMKSKYPKVTFNVLGQPIVSHVINAVKKLNPFKIITVVGYLSDYVINSIKSHHNVENQIEFVYQHEQKGTGHAVMQAKQILTTLNPELTLILCGDTPLITSDILNNLITTHQNNNYAATVLTTTIENPKGYGRIIRNNDNTLLQIIEERDADLETKKITEVNSGIYVFSTNMLLKVIDKLEDNNSQNEYYLTDTIKLLNNLNYKVGIYHESDSTLILGINNRFELLQVEKIMRAKINKMHMLNGVTILNSDTTYIDLNVEIEPDVTIYPETYILGNTKIKSGSIIGPMTYIINSTIGENVKIFYSVIEESEIKNNVIIGPYSHLRPQTVLGENVHIGNFVEIKKSKIGDRSKANHLTYIGDAEVGCDCNIGAGTITCNYDGINKHKTIIGDKAFIGSNTSLIAPIEIGSEALVAAGSVINKNVPNGALAIERSQVVIKEDYVKRRKFKK